MVAGRNKYIINSEIFNERQVPSNKNLVNFSPLVKDLLRGRYGNYWEIKETFPKINTIIEERRAFSIGLNRPIQTIENSQEIFGETLQSIVLLPNRDLYKFDPGFTLVARSTFNPEFWKIFISENKQPAIINEPQEVLQPLSRDQLVQDPRETIRNTTVQSVRTNELINPQSSFNVRNDIGTIREGLQVASARTQATIGVSSTPSRTNSVNNGSITPRSEIAVDVQNLLNNNRETITTNVTSTPTGLSPENFIISSFGTIPTLKDGEEYLDHAFDLSVPFTKNDLNKINIPFLATYADINPNYNFFINSYENIISDNNIKEQLLPNMYVFCSELQNENTDAKNTIFKQHISLAGNIQDVFIDVLNNKGEKIGEKDKGEYFDKYASTFDDLLRRNITDYSFLIQKFTNLITPISSIDLFKDFNEKCELFPMYFDINFTTDNTTKFTKALEESQLFSFLIRDIIEKNIEEQPSNFSETESIIVQDGKEIKKTNISEIKPFKTWDLNIWIKKLLTDPISVFKDLSSGIFLGSIQQEVSLINNSQFDLYKNLLIIILMGKLKTIVNTHFRSFNDLIEGKLAYSENLFYKIEKRNTETNELIQNFYLPNSDKVNVLRFIDTQVKYNKKYTYSIFAYQLVLGNKYKYKLQTLTDFGAEVDVLNTPSIKIVEVLYFKSTERIMDSPPVFPDVSMIPYRGVNNQILINISNGVGEYKLKPVIIEAKDEIIVQQLKEAQKNEEMSFLNYKGDDHVSAFEVFRITEKPTSYQDFTGNRVALIKADVSALTLQSATAASFLENILPNKKYYYIFRTIDNHGHISNPTLVYELELIDDNGSVYPSIKIVDFETTKNKSMSKTFKKFIQIVPSFKQRIVNEEKSGFIVNEEKIKSVLDKDKIHLGLTEEQVWGKNFKIKITSLKTGKKIDVNISFNHTHIKKT